MCRVRILAVMCSSTRCLNQTQTESKGLYLLSAFHYIAMCKSFCCWATLTWINGNWELLSLSLLLRPVLLTCVSCKLCQAHTLNLDARYERGLPDLWQHEVWFSQMLSFHINVMMLVSSFVAVLIIHDPFLSENMSVFSLASLLVPHLGLWSDSTSHLDSVPVQQSTESCVLQITNFVITLLKLSVQVPKWTLAKIVCEWKGTSLHVLQWSLTRRNYHSLKFHWSASYFKLLNHVNISHHLPIHSSLGCRL